jgi:hypothetical protein
MPLPLRLLDAAEAAKYQRNAREYDTAEGKRLNVSAIVAKYHIKLATFYKRQQHGWPALNGGVLTTVNQACPTAPNGKEATFLEAEVAQCVQDPPANDDRFLIDGVWWLTRERVTRELHTNRFMLIRKWDVACPYLDGKALAPSPMQSPATRALVSLYTKDTIEQVKERMLEVKNGRWVDSSGQAWLSRARARRALRVGSQDRSRTTLHWWKGSPSRYLGGRKLRTCKPGFKRNPFSDDPIGQWDLWYLEEDILRIKAALLAKRQAQAEARQASRTPVRRQKPIALFNANHKGIFDEPGERRFTISEAAKKSGISKGRLWQWLRDGLPKALGLQGIFPGNRLPVERRLVPNSEGHWVTTIGERDLQNLKAALGNVLHSEKPSRQEKTCDEICNLYEIGAVPGGRRKVFGLLQILRENGSVSARPIRRQCASRRRWVSPWYYRVDELAGFLAGRDIIEAADELSAEQGAPAGSPRGRDSFGAAAPITTVNDQCTLDRRKRPGRPRGSKSVKTAKKHPEIVETYQSRLNATGIAPTITEIAVDQDYDRKTVRKALSEAGVLVR